MTNEEIRQKAIECGEAFEIMCNSKGISVNGEFGRRCYCEYNEVASCSMIYGYEHGYADGVKEGKRLEEEQTEAEIRADERAKCIKELIEATLESPFTSDKWTAVHKWIAKHKNHEYMTDCLRQDEMSEVAIDALGKQKAKKPIRHWYSFCEVGYRCPTCGQKLRKGCKICRCGQHINWEGVTE